MLHRQNRLICIKACYQIYLLKLSNIEQINYLLLLLKSPENLWFSNDSYGKKVNYFAIFCLILEVKFDDNTGFDNYHKIDIHNHVSVPQFWHT